MSTNKYMAQKWVMSTNEYMAQNWVLIVGPGKLGRAGTHWEVIDICLLDAKG